MKEFKLERFCKEAELLFGEVKSALGNSSQDGIRNRISSIPDELIDSNHPITVVFAGQYSAGKSTILSILTGKKLAVGGGVTTAETQELDWNGIKVIDTPGIHTQKHPDHDAITYEAIAKADLIIFVVTGEGFSDHLGNHFRKLLIDKQKGNEMMLLVNKMESTKLGNVPEQQEIIKADIDKVIGPNYSTDSLYTVFVDASIYQEALDEEETSESEWMLKAANFDALKETMNQFVADKNLIGRTTTNLYKLEQQLVEIIASIGTGDNDVDIVRHMLTKKRRILVESRERIKDKASAITRRHTQPISQWGNDVANRLSSSQKEAEVNAMLEEKFVAVNEIPSNVIAEIEELLNVETNKIQKSVDNLNDSEFGKIFLETITAKIKERNLDPKTAQTLGKVASGATELGKLISKWSTGTNAANGFSNLTKLGNFSQSAVHHAVLKIGHFFGHKFVPWEAVKWAKGIGMAGKVIGVAGSVIGIFLQINQDKQEEKIEVQLQDARAEIRSNFTDAANVIDLKFDEVTQTWVEDNIEPNIADIDNKLLELNNLMETQNSQLKLYNDLLARTRKLISEIHAS